MKRFGILLTAGPEALGFSELLKFLEQRKADEAIYFYLVDEGVLAFSALHQNQSNWHVYACAFSARQRGLSLDEGNVIFCGLSMLADILESVDVMVGVGNEMALSFSSEKKVVAKRLVLLEMISDPRVSGKAAEGIRIAAGVGVWEKVQLEIGFRKAGVNCLTSEQENLVGGEAIERELALLQKSVLWVDKEDLKRQTTLSLPKMKVLTADEILQREKKAWFVFSF